uniref:Uncharacterized protein n=1 Tax=Mycolicibacterium gilvum (strain PYR-GCK) TaxID=350054 RepID=A4TFU6_MYCGI
MAESVDDDRRERVCGDPERVRRRRGPPQSYRDCDGGSEHNHDSSGWPAFHPYHFRCSGRASQEDLLLTRIRCGAAILAFGLLGVELFE